jgi:hypothetical protein
MAPSPSDMAPSRGQVAALEQPVHVSGIDTRGPPERHHHQQAVMSATDGPRALHTADASDSGEGRAAPQPPSGFPSSHYPHPGTRAQTQTQSQAQPQTQTQTRAQTSNVPGARPHPLDEVQEFFQHELSEMVGAFPSPAEVAMRQAVGNSKPASSSSHSASMMGRNGSEGGAGEYVGVPLSEEEKQAAKEEARQLAEGAGLPPPGAP